MRGLFLEADDAPVLVRFDHAKSFRRLCRIDFKRRNGHVRGRLDVLLEHLLVIHFVDVIAGQNENVIRLLTADRINVLVNGVRGPKIPVLRDTHLRRQHFDELPQTHQYGPTAPNVAVEAESLVLRQDEDTPQIAVETVREGYVDDAIDAAEWDGRFGAIAGERPKPLALAAS
jgi:hypothetical protein